MGGFRGGGGMLGGCITKMFVFNILVYSSFNRGV